MAEMEELSRQSGEILLEMERFKYRAGAVALVLDLRKAFERVSLPVVWAWAKHFSFARKIGVCSSKDVRRSRSGPSRPSCQGQSGAACFGVLYLKMR